MHDRKREATKNCSREFEFLNSNESLNWSSLVDLSLAKEDEKKITKELINREMYGSRESGIYSEYSNQESSSPGCGRSRFDRHEDRRKSKRNLKKTSRRSNSQPVSGSKDI